MVITHVKVRSTPTQIRVDSMLPSFYAAASYGQMAIHCPTIELRYSLSLCTIALVQQEMSSLSLHQPVFARSCGKNAPIVAKDALDAELAAKVLVLRCLVGDAVNFGR
jgi:hypothetical protein